MVRMLTKGVLLHDNMWPHTAAGTNVLIKLFNWEIFDHPPYSPDLAPIDYHLFTKMKVWLGTQCFHTNEEFKSSWMESTTGCITWRHRSLMTDYKN
jgi:transposase